MAIFLGERKTVGQDLLVLDATFDTMKMTTKAIKSKHCMEGSSFVESWVEIWDYVGDTKFKGFVGGIGFTRSLFVFIGEDILGKDIKHGYEHFRWKM